MKNLLGLMFLAIFLLSFTGCDEYEWERLRDSMSGLESDEEGIENRAAVAVPFKGKYTTYPEVSDPDEYGAIVAIIPSEGKATHLGKSTWFSNSVVETNNGEPPWSQTGDMLFTAADGSTLVGEFTGISMYTEEYPFAGNGEYTITHGTDRFEGTTGSGKYFYVVNIIDGQLVGDLKFEGELNMAD